MWDRTSDRVYLFDATDSVSGVTAFHDAHLDRSGEALIVNGDVTRVWRYRTQQQSDAVQLESNGDSGVMKTMAHEDDAFDLFGSTRSRNFPAKNRAWPSEATPSVAPTTSLPLPPKIAGTTSESVTAWCAP